MKFVGKSGLLTEGVKLSGVPFRDKDYGWMELWRISVSECRMCKARATVLISQAKGRRMNLLQSNSILCVIHVTGVR